MDEEVEDSGRLPPLVEEKNFRFSQPKRTKKQVYTNSNGLENWVLPQITPLPFLQKDSRSATGCGLGKDVSMDEWSMKYTQPNYWNFETIYWTIKYMPTSFICKLKVREKFYLEEKLLMARFDRALFTVGQRAIRHSDHNHQDFTLRYFEMIL